MLLPTGYTYDNVEAKKVLKEQFGDLKVKDAKSSDSHPNLALRSEGVG